MNPPILPSSFSDFFSLNLSHTHTAVKLSTKLISPLPSPIPTIAMTESPLFFIGGSGYPYRPLFPSNELALNRGRFPVRFPSEAGIAPESLFPETSKTESLTRSPSCCGIGPDSLLSWRSMTFSQLVGDRAGEVVGRQIEDGEVDEVLQIGRDGAAELVGGEVEGLEVCTIGDEGGDGAAEGEAGEGELVDAAIVAGGALEEGSEALAGVGEGGLGPVEEGSSRDWLSWVRQASSLGSALAAAAYKARRTAARRGKRWRRQPLMPIYWHGDLVHAKCLINFPSGGKATQRLPARVLRWATPKSKPIATTSRALPAETKLSQSSISLSLSPSFSPSLSPGHHPYSAIESQSRAHPINRAIFPLDFKPGKRPRFSQVQPLFSRVHFSDTVFHQPCAADSRRKLARDKRCASEYCTVAKILSIRLSQYLTLASSSSRRKVGVLKRKNRSNALSWVVEAAISGLHSHAIGLCIIA
ncbi:polynucleotidyl transferase [Striga asiatica]|uniref:Polynucleotidyl transferase n=1 Tax=Striga asiatica TaxID=4170 RepID=A0A5A7Q6G1_STRAF|nr:polynucleotidyl transferase [Striga asiatica]